MPGIKKLTSSINFQVWALIAAAIIIRCVYIFYTNYVAEDAFITFQFAKQIASGHGFVFNTGQPIYGTTTPLFALLTAIWFKLSGGDVITGSRILDLAAVFGVFYFTQATLQQLKVTPAQQFLVLAALAFSPRLWFMDTEGMETPLVIFFMAASWYTFVTGRIYWTGILTGLLLWTRIDLLPWVLILICAVGPTSIRKAFRLGLTSALIYLPWVLFALLYFGSPIPFTITAKWVAYAQYNTQPLTDHLKIVFEYLSPFDYSVQYPKLGLIFALCTTGIAGWLIYVQSKNKSLVILAVFAVEEILRLVLTRATFFQRYFVPALWVVLILFGLGLGALWQKAVGKSTYLKIAYAVFLIIFLASGWAAALEGINHVRDTQIYRQEAALKSIGIWFNQNSTEGATVLLEPLGYIGYYADRTMLDEVGLITPRVVELKSQGYMDVYQYMIILQPDYVVLHCDDSLEWQKRTDGNGNEFVSNYQKAASFNPLNFDPKEETTESLYQIIRRSSCYEIWKKND